MPKKIINDYDFYKIVCLDNSIKLCYVGSTANLRLRKSDHKYNCKNENSKKYNVKIYKTIRENGGWENFKMIQIGTREQLTKREAEQIEEEYRIQLKAELNMKRCFTTEEQKKEYNKKHKEQNKEYYKEQNKEHYKNYRKVNKEKILEYHKNYREENRDKINEKNKEKVKCDCGCLVNYSSLLKHKKTKKHLKIIECKTANNNN